MAAMQEHNPFIAEQALLAATQGNMSACMPLLAQIPDEHHTGASKLAFLKMFDAYLEQNRVEAKQMVYLYGASLNWEYESDFVERILFHPSFRRDLLSADGYIDCWKLLQKIAIHHTLLVKNYVVVLAAELEDVLTLCDQGGHLSREIIPILINLVAKTIGHCDSGNLSLNRLIYSGSLNLSSLMLWDLIESVFLRMVQDCLHETPGAAYSVPLFLLDEHWGRRVRQQHYYQLLTNLFVQTNSSPPASEPDQDELESVFHRWVLDGSKANAFGDSSVQFHLSKPPVMDEQQDFVRIEAAAWGSVVTIVAALDRRQEIAHAGVDLGVLLKRMAENSLLQVNVAKTVKDSMLEASTGLHWQVRFACLRLFVANHLLMVHSADFGMGHISNDEDAIPDILEFVRDENMALLRVFAVQSCLEILSWRTAHETESREVLFQLFEACLQELSPVMMREKQVASLFNAQLAGGFDSLSRSIASILEALLRVTHLSHQAYSHGQEFIAAIPSIESTCLRALVTAITCKFFDSHPEHPLAWYTVHCLLTRAIDDLTEGKDASAEKEKLGPHLMAAQNACLAYPLRLLISILHSRKHGDDDLKQLESEATRSGALDLQEVVNINNSTSREAAIGSMNMEDLDSLVSPLSDLGTPADLGEEELMSDRENNIYCPPHSALLHGVDFAKVRDLVTQLKELDPDFDGSPYSDGEDEISSVGGDGAAAGDGAGDSGDAVSEADSCDVNPCTEDGKLACGLTVDERDELVEAINKIRRENHGTADDESGGGQVESARDGAETLGRRVLRDIQNNVGGGSTESSGTQSKPTKPGEFAALLKSATAALEQQTARDDRDTAAGEEESTAYPTHLVEAIERRNDSLAFPLTETAQTQALSQGNALLAKMVAFVGATNNMHLSERTVVIQAVGFIIEKKLGADMDSLESSWPEALRKYKEKVDDRVSDSSDLGFPSEADACEHLDNFIDLLTTGQMHRDTAATLPFLWFPCVASQSSANVLFQHRLEECLDGQRIVAPTADRTIFLVCDDHLGHIRMSYCIEHVRPGVLYVYSKVTNEGLSSVYFKAGDNISSGSSNAIAMTRCNVPAENEMTLKEGQDFTWATRYKYRAAEPFQIDYRLLLRVQGKEWSSYCHTESFSSFDLTSPFRGFIGALPDSLSIDSIVALQLPAQEELLRFHATNVADHGIATNVAQSLYYKFGVGPDDQISMLMASKMTKCARDTYHLVSESRNEKRANSKSTTPYQSHDS